MITYPPFNISGLTITDPTLDDSLGLYDISATGDRQATLQRTLGLLRLEPGGRLTLTSGQPIYVADVTGTTLYYSPYVNDLIVLWDGTRWLPYQVPEFGIPLGTLVTGAGYDVFAFTSTATPSSTNTSTDIVTFGSPTGWQTGSIVTIASTVGGLTYGTTYFYNAASTTTGSFHTTLANALAGTSKVDLTANVTAALTAVSLELNAWRNGTATITIASPGVVTFNSHLLNSINFYDPITFTTTGALPTGLSANTIYYAQSVTTNTFRLIPAVGPGTAINTSGSQSGTHTCWMSRQRGTDVTVQDGRYCKSGDKTRLHLGSFRASSTTQTTNTYSNQYLWNRYNQVNLPLYVSTSSSHTYNGGYRYFNNTGASALACFSGDIQQIPVSIFGEAANAAGVYAIVGMGINRIDNPYLYVYLTCASAISFAMTSSGVAYMGTVGSFILTALESTVSTGTSTFGTATIQGIMRG